MEWLLSETMESEVDDAAEFLSRGFHTKPTLSCTGILSAVMCQSDFPSLNFLYCRLW